MHITNSFVRNTEIQGTEETREIKMDYLMILIPKLLRFLILIAIGFVVSKLGVIKKEVLPTLSGLLINVAMPLLIISIMNQQATSVMDLLEFRRMVGWQLFGYFLLALTGVLVSKLLRLDHRSGNVHRGSMVGGNYAFIVLPLIMTLFTPEDGQQYIPVCSAVDTLTAWTLALSFFSQGVDNGGRSKLAIIGKKFINPIMVAIVGMLILNSLSVRLPEPFLAVSDELGNASLCLGLIYVGAVICYMEKGNLTTIKNSSILTISKLIVVPFVVYLVTSRFMPETESIILMLIAGSPTFTVSCVLAEQYHLDLEYAATNVFLTTTGCLLSIPLLFVLITFV